MAPFEIFVTGGVLRAVLRGYWDAETASRYVAELGRRGRADRHRIRHWLINAADFQVQSQEVSEIIRHGVVHATGDAPPQIALVPNSALVAIQARRIAKGAGHRTFSSLAEAEAWLAAGPQA